MSFVLDDKNSLVQVSIYLKKKQIGNGVRSEVISDEEAQELLANEDTKDEVDVINTGWKELSWKDHNAIMKECVIPTINAEGLEKNQVDVWRFNELMIKACLKAWDIIGSDGKPLAPSEENIEKIPAHIVNALNDKYQQITGGNEEDQKK